jgi:hypothetical protein
MPTQGMVPEIFRRWIKPIDVIVFFRTVIVRLKSGLCMKNELKEEIMKRVVGGKLACAAARKIAEDLHLTYKEVGEAADELSVKIKSCELGCF